MAVVPDLDLLKPATDASGVKLPTRYAEALTQVRLRSPVAPTPVYQTTPFSLP
jgi:hypothetical protein